MAYLEDVKTVYTRQNVIFAKPAQLIPTGYFGVLTQAVGSETVQKKLHENFKAGAPSVVLHDEHLLANLGEINLFL
jgi:hypothetical protein